MPGGDEFRTGPTGEVGEVDPDMDPAIRVPHGGANGVSAVVVSVGRDHRLRRLDEFRVRSREMHKVRVGRHGQTIGARVHSEADPPLASHQLRTDNRTHRDGQRMSQKLRSATLVRDEPSRSGQPR